MAQSKIPGPLERRHLIEREISADRALAFAEAYLEQSRAVEAVEFLAKAEAPERLAELRRDATSCPLGSAYFSLLRPGTRLAAHCGPTNGRLRAHLGLVVPSEAEGPLGIRCGEEERADHPHSLADQAGSGSRAALLDLCPGVSQRDGAVEDRRARLGV